ncbi:extracellular solute-binding protein [Microlunatus capsulatus]|uniref:Aldouronate transport system substrate-binding protein n=1 Tax=Microlunatus capsulatus TaxID=99117 RepID=A0ABS4Z552_9ACTN|nr:extracellular solute-binding protein [Microlunatus capsulatus]MBP2416177.1 putative aldouronate transport system substrate-binding protein [Microlunatus capsulatus]
MPSSPTFSRRSLLLTTTGLAAAALVPGLAACSSGPGSGATASGAAVQLPTRRAAALAEPDLPGTASGVPDGFLRYPADPKPSVSEAPGTGAAVTALLSSFAVAPTSAPRNAYAAELNTRLRAELALQVVPAADYAVKLATTVSSGDLPDVLEMLPVQPQLPQLLGATCADLTPFLAGDAVLDYPNLAACTPDMWRTTVFDGKIFGVPVPRPVQSVAPFVRTDLLEQRGLDPDVTSWEQLLDLCAALTEPKRSRYAFSLAPVSYLTGALGGIADWAEQDGTFVRYQESPQYREALARCAELSGKGFLHPDAFAANATVLGKQRLVGGQVGIHPDGFSAWGSLARFLPAGQQEVIGALPVAGFDGATPTYTVSAGSSNFTVIRKADEGRVRELLRILDYLSAPFGSAEFLFRKYGTAGVQHTVEGGNPTLTKKGTDEVTPVTEALDYHLADGMKVAYEGALTGITKAKHAYASAAEPAYVRSATTGLYSETFARRNNNFVAMITDVQNGVITGRRPLTDLDEALKTWNDGDGATIKRELAAAKEQQ